jgi:hypothetical protein
MKHEQFKEWLHLSAINEIDDDAQGLLDIHLRECSECRVELKELQDFYSIIEKQEPIDVSDALLYEARQQLRTALLRERLEKSMWEKVLGSARGFMVREYKTAFGGFAVAALGLFVGYLVFAPPRMAENKIVQREQPVVRQAIQSGDRSDSFTQSDTRTSNVRFVDSDASDGVIEFTFDAVTPMHVRGNVNDDKVQKVLARALTNEDNAGIRLQTVGAIAMRVQGEKNSDPEVKAALISALTGDQNPGVRQAALRVLLQYPLDGEIKNALVVTLTHDKNSGNRIAAINGLASASVEGHHMDQDILNVLKQKIQSDNNNYVRRQARTVVEEAAHR